MTTSDRTFGPQPRTLGALLHPGRQGERLRIGLSIGGGLALLLLAAGVPLWLATIFLLEAIAGPLILKWLDDRDRFGGPLMALSVLLSLQVLHGIEHIAQWAQFHVFGWPAKQSGGLISPLNAELVHFAWNWLVWLAVAFLVWRGMRNPWAWLLLAWASAHTLEHTYLFIQYAQAGGLQGLPGVLGRGGWLARSAGASPAVSFICDLAPPLKTAARLDVHFWWNVGETALLALAAGSSLRRGQLVARPE